MRKRRYEVERQGFLPSSARGTRRPIRGEWVNDKESTENAAKLHSEPRRKVG